MSEIDITGSDGKQCSMTCLPLRKLAGWLYSAMRTKSCVSCAIRSSSIKKSATSFCGATGRRTGASTSRIWKMRAARVRPP
ncbi:hypothetical protein DBY65_010515 [Pseudomonas sp. RIT412]|nr:hypothetical protein DBY65_010515 [Pseudomonas sp. RIT 412]